MAKVKSQGNHSTEIRLVRLFRAHGVSGWRRHQDIEGSPDFVFPKARVMVFVDGCFWHGCPKHCRLPVSHSQYWREKIGRNKARDARANRRLRRDGWRVFRVWEHEIQADHLPQRLLTATGWSDRRAGGSGIGGG
jgi:DNA mismatch endonuclease (patch repair protein)